MSPVTRYVTKLAAIGICVLTSVLTIKIPTSEARPDCNIPWRKSGTFLTEKYSDWISTRPPVVGSRAIQFREAYGNQYYRVIWNGKECVTQVGYDYGADYFRVRECPRTLACTISRWVFMGSLQNHPGIQLQHLNRYYGFDPYNGKIRVYNPQ